MSEVWPDFNDWWDYGNPAETAVKFQTRLNNPAETDTPAYRLQLQTQLARTHSLRRNFAEAERLLDAVEAKMAGQDVVEVRYLLERGRSYHSAGEPETAVFLFQRAASLSKAIGADFYYVDALHMLGIAAPPEGRLDWNQLALAAAEASQDVRAQRWQGALLNNIGWTQLEQEDYAAALETFEKTAVFYANNPQQMQNYQIARWSIAKTLRLLGQPEVALPILRELEAAGKEDGFTEEELGESLLAAGRDVESTPYFQQAFEKLSNISWVAADAQRIERLRRLGVA